MDDDISRLKTTAVAVLNDLGCNGSTVTEDLISEMCRFGASELHAVAAFIGGIASQEVIKVYYLFSSFHYYQGMFSVVKDFNIWLVWEDLRIRYVYDSL